MKETQMPPASSANLVADNGSTIYGVSVIGRSEIMINKIWIKLQTFSLKEKGPNMLSAKWNINLMCAFRY